MGRAAAGSGAKQKPAIQVGERVAEVFERMLARLAHVDGSLEELSEDRIETEERRSRRRQDYCMRADQSACPRVVSVRLFVCSSG